MGSTLQEQFQKLGLVKQGPQTTKAESDQKNVDGENRKSGKRKKTGRKDWSSISVKLDTQNGPVAGKPSEQETAARIRQMIDTRRLPMNEGDTPYNFTDDQKIKRLFLPKDLVEQLSKGSLAIVRQAGDYQIVPAEVAEEVKKHNRKQVIVFHAAQERASGESKDPYADYRIPDDLTW